MRNPISTTTPDHQIAAAKRQNHHHDQSLLAGIPDHLSHLCLSLVPPAKLYAVCRSWRRLIYSPNFPPFLSLYALFLPAADNHHHNLSNPLQLASFDPISAKWQPLPAPPPDWPLRFLFRHPSFISRKIPVQSVAVAGKLVVLAATNDDFLPALSQPLIFDPLAGEWSLGPSFPAPRRWCSAGASRGAVFVASGIGSQYNTDVARSVEKWVVDSRRHSSPPRRRRWSWQKMGNLKDGKFSRDAIDAIGWRGKLCMVNVSGDAAKEGIIYDIEEDSWAEMPEGMLSGWRGPAAAMDEETIYAVDESKGMLKKYDHVKDAWVLVMEDTRLKGAQQLAAAGGRVCVSAADGNSIVVVDVVAPPPLRLWMVDAPPGFQVSALHILPRLSNAGDENFASIFH